MTRQPLVTACTMPLMVSSEEIAISPEAWTGFKPNTAVREGVARFVAWYRDFYGV